MIMGVRETLLFSDVEYFRLAADRRELAGGGELLWIDGCHELAAGCVGVAPCHELTTLAGAWVSELEQAVRSVGSTLARVYLQTPQRYLAAALRERGYREKREYAMASTIPVGTRGTHGTIRPVTTLEDWRELRMVFEDSEDGPDGHTNPAEAWFELIRRKSATGRLSYGLIMRSEDVVGAVGWMNYDGVTRLKNLSIRPYHRRLGCGFSAVSFLHGHALASGRRLGVFAIQGSPGEQLYKQFNMWRVGAQSEWSKWLQT